MLRIKDNPLKKPASDVTFEVPATNQKQGIEMLIALNLTTRTLVTGPDVGLDSKILVTKAKPHFYFNPTITEPKDLQTDPEPSTIHLSYTNYLGSTKEITLIDEDGEIKKAIDRLHNGIDRAQRQKKG